MIYLLTAIGLSPGGNVHLHTNNTQNNINNDRTTQIQTDVEECRPCPIFVSFTLAFAVQLRKKHGKTSVRVRKTSVRLRKTSVKVQYTYYQKHPHITKPSQTHTLQNPLIHPYVHTHTTKQYKTTTVQIKTKCIQEKQQYVVSNVVNPQVQHTIFNRTFTALYLTSLHFTSPTINTLQGTPRFNPLHCTKLYFTSLQFTALFRQFTTHSLSLQLTTLITLLTLFLSYLTQFFLE